MAFTLELLTAWTGGCVLAGAEDMIPDNRLRVARNVRLDRTLGAILSRAGVTAKSAVIDASFVTTLWLSKLFASTDSGYVQVSDGATSKLYRLNSAWAAPVALATGLLTTVISDTNWLTGETTPMKYLVGPFMRKDDGTTLTTFGIAQPVAAPASAILGTRSRLALHAFDAVGSWVGTNTGALATDGTIKQEGTNSVTFTVAANTLGRIAIPFSAGDAQVNGTHTGAGPTDAFLTDNTKNFVTRQVRLGARVRNTTQSFEGTVTRITTRVNPNDTLQFDGGLGGNSFNAGNAYEIYFDLDTFQVVPTSASGTDNSGTDDKTTRMVDTTKNFDDLGVRPGMILWNTSNGCHGTITSLGTTTNTNDTLNVTGGFTGSTDNDFDNGNTYSVFNDLVKDDDWIHLSFRVDFSDRLEFIQVDADVDTTTLANAFANNYYSLRISSSRLNEGANQWTELLLRKSEFVRHGTGTQGWEAVRALRLSFQTNNTSGGVTIWVDDLSLIGGIGIEGKIQYTAIYKNNNTGGRGSPPKTGDQVVFYTTEITVARHPITVDLSNIISPSDTQITHIFIYRKDPAFSDATFVARVAVGTASFVDQRAPVQLDRSKILEVDNDVPPSTATVIFGPGATNRLFVLYNRNKLRWSKAWQIHENRAENWPIAFEASIGDGSQLAVNGAVQDQNLVVWTEEAAWWVSGQGPDAYLPIAIPQSRGLAARNAVAHGDGQDFFLSQDGIYSQKGMVQTKLTAEIDPFFRGQTVNGVLGINRTVSVMALARMAYYPHPQVPFVVLLYAESGSTTLNKVLLLKKNTNTGEYTDVFFDDYANFTAQSVFVDPHALELLLGTSTSRVVQAEVETATDDLGTGITIRARTKAYSQGKPTHIKTYRDAVVEANTNGVALTVDASYNKGVLTEALGTMNGTTDSTEVELVSTSTARRKNIALDLSATVAQQVKVFKLGWHVQLEAEELTFFDSGIVPFGMVTALKYLLFDIDTTANVTIRVYLDEVLRDTRPVLPTTARERRNHYLPAGLKGRSLRVTGEATTAFVLWHLSALVKTWGRAIGYGSQVLKGG